MKPEELELERLKRNSNAVLAFKEGIRALKGSGVLDLLRRFARPFTRDGGANPYCAAYSAAVAEGYNKCLDDLTYFEEMYLGEDPRAKGLVPTFGGLELALKRGDITQFEKERL